MRRFMTASACPGRRRGPRRRRSPARRRPTATASARRRTSPGGVAGIRDGHEGDLHRAAHLVADHGAQHERLRSRGGGDHDVRLAVGTEFRHRERLVRGRDLAPDLLPSLLVHTQREGVSRVLRFHAERDGLQGGEPAQHVVLPLLVGGALDPRDPGVRGAGPGPGLDLEGLGLGRGRGGLEASATPQATLQANRMHLMAWGSREKGRMAPGAARSAFWERTARGCGAARLE